MAANGLRLTPSKTEILFLGNGGAGRCGPFLWLPPEGGIPSQERSDGLPLCFLFRLLESKEQEPLCFHAGS